VKTALDRRVALLPRPAAELQMWLRLLACSNLVTGRLRQMLRRDFNISLPTFDILAQIARPPLGPTMGELSKRLMVSKGSVTDLVERLIAQGLILRHSDSLDARVQRVHLTAKGKRLLDRVLPAHNAFIRELMAGLGAAETTRLSAQLGHLRSLLRDAQETPRPTKPRSQRGATAKPRTASSSK
jgi:DNA-binding MarR family transcriptional regulator